MEMNQKSDYVLFKGPSVCNQRGFTLIELMVVAVILAIIAAIAVPIYNGYKQEALAQEAYQVLSQWAELCSGRFQKAHETSTTATAPAIPDNTVHFSYSSSPDAGESMTDSITLTATGRSGAVSGETLTITVTNNSGVITKELGGTLY